MRQKTHIMNLASRRSRWSTNARHSLPTLLTLFCLALSLPAQQAAPAMPMHANDEDGAEFRWLNKKVLNTRLLDSMAVCRELAFGWCNAFSAAIKPFSSEEALASEVSSFQQTSRTTYLLMKAKCELAQQERIFLEQPRRRAIAKPIAKRGIVAGPSLADLCHSERSEESASKPRRQELWPVSTATINPY
jgi:hypothetical protein